MYSQNDWRNYSDELMHYGILGQKWGVRRYQNADGSLTNAGRERYGSPSKNYRQISKAVKANDDYFKNRKRLLKNKTLQEASKEVSKSYKAWIDADKKYNDAYDEFYNDEKTFRKYAKRSGIKGDPYKVIGGDYDGVAMWEKYVSETPKVKALEEECFEAQKNFEISTRKVADKILGEYADNRLPDRSVTGTGETSTSVRYIVQDTLGTLNQLHYNNDLADVASYDRRWE